jgi:hypothetical protein
MFFAPPPRFFTERSVPTVRRKLRLTPRTAVATSLKDLYLS